MTVLFILLWTLFGQLNTSSAETTTRYTVQVGDSWEALAWRFGLTSAELQALNPPSLNPHRQPIIGSQLIIPATPAKNGRLIRPLPHTSSALFALEQGLRFWDGLLIPYQPIFLAKPDHVPTDLPIGYTQFALSHTAAPRGQGFAFRAELRPESADLPTQAFITGINGSTLPFAFLRTGTHEVAVRGTGAFFPLGTHPLSIQVGDHPLWSQPYQLIDRVWEYQTIEFTGAAAQIDSEAIATENARLFSLWEKHSAELFWQKEFQEPLTNYVSLTSLYGTRRSTDGGNSYPRYHEGVDFAAYQGTEVLASADGLVVIAEPLYVRGGAVILDHGMGIYSGYYHLSNVIASAGQTVQAGDLIGEVGTTGLSTGNHLHWDFLVTGAWVDAQAWVAEGMGCWLLEGLQRSCR